MMMSTPCAPFLFVFLTLIFFTASHHAVVESFAPVKVIKVSRRPTTLFYQEGPSTDQQRVAVDTSKATHINDFNHETILNNTLSLPVLIDCYTDKCGPCKLIERSLQQVLPKFISPHEDESRPRLQFVKWDVESREHSKRFMSILREHDMTFRKLPTLLLFDDGVPMALKSGMMSAAAIDRWLEEHLPDGEGKGRERRPRVGPEGALGVSTRKMNR
mmetsp:Transcript_21533/g.30791  ORF Transcript_21533/g.30791 Transcript_21533/m.30791 type:complete len:216 (-) Transcript_21533:402-1049(-)